MKNITTSETKIKNIFDRAVYNLKLISKEVDLFKKLEKYVDEKKSMAEMVNLTNQSAYSLKPKLQIILGPKYKNYAKQRQKRWKKQTTKTLNTMC